MSRQVYPPIAVVRNLVAFYERRGYDLAPRGGAAGSAPAAPTDDEVVTHMERLYYVRIDARRRAPRGARDWAVALVLASDRKYTRHAPDLRPLLENVLTEPAAPRLDELIVVTERGLGGQANLAAVFADLSAGGARGADAAGAAPYFAEYPFRTFICVVPDHLSVPPHRVLSDAEAAELLARERAALGDFPVIYDSDPAAVWCGARVGQVVEILRDSPTVGRAVAYRRVERGP